MRARSKAVNPLYRLGWLAADWPTNNVFNSRPVFAPRMTQLVTHTFELCNRHLGWPSGTVDVLSLAYQGFEIDCNELSRLFQSRFDHRDSYIDVSIAIETTFAIIDCIGDHYYYMDTS